MQKGFLEQPIQPISWKTGHWENWSRIGHANFFFSLFTASYDFFIFIHLKKFHYIWNHHLYYITSFVLMLYSHSTFLNVHTSLGGPILLTVFVVLAPFNVQKTLISSCNGNCQVWFQSEREVICANDMLISDFISRIFSLAMQSVWTRRQRTWNCSNSGGLTRC